MGYSRCLWGSCRNNSNNRPPNVTFVPFPKPWIDKTKCLKWMELCGLIEKKFDITEIDYNTRICDIHFVGGKGPTPLYPDPYACDLDPHQMEKLAAAKATSSGRLATPSLKCMESSTTQKKNTPKKTSKSKKSTVRSESPPLDLPVLAETSICIASVDPVDSICPTDFLETSIKLEAGDSADEHSNEEDESVFIKECSENSEQENDTNPLMDEESCHENEELKEVTITKRKRLMDNICDVPTCGQKCNHNLGISLHNVPLPNRGLVTFTNKEGQVETMDCRKAWLKLTQIDLDFENGDPGKQGKICSMHFLPSDFIPGGPKRRLRNNVLPSQNLPQKTEVSASTLMTDTQIMEMERVVREGIGRTVSTTQMTDSSGQLMRMFTPDSETSTTSLPPAIKTTTKPLGKIAPAPVSKLCRMCAAACDDMIAIFSEEGRKANLVAKLKQHVNVVIYDVDNGLPKQICTSCANKLEECHEMVKNCERVGILLNSLLRQERENIKETVMNTPEANFVTKVVASTPASTPTRKSQRRISSIESTPKKQKVTETAPKKQKLTETTPKKQKLTETTPKKQKLTEPKKEKNPNGNQLPTPTKVSETNTENNDTTTSIPEPTLKCRFCDTRYFTKRTLRSHYIDDHRAYLCPHCDLYFDSHAKLKEHDYFSHFLICPYCKARFRKDELVNHMKLHNALPVFVNLKKYPHEKIQCKLCTSTAGDRAVAKNHYFREHLMYACEICLELFPTSEEQTNHTDEVHMIPCSYCDEKNYTYHRHKRHVNKNHKIQSAENQNFPKTSSQIYECKFCNKGLTSKEFVRRHNYWSHFQYTCNICLETFRTAELEQQHFKIHQNNICLLCDDGNFTNLKEHIILKHNNEYKPYSCENCGNKYTEINELNEHRTEHEQVKTHLCDECGKNFKSHNILVQHRYTHQPEEEKGRYNCNFCGKRYVFMSQLKVHMVKHTHEKSYQCKDCIKSFSTSNALRHHMEIHLKNGDMMKYQCEYCKIVFQCKETYHEHVDEVHNQIWIFRCNVCFENCMSESDINTHMSYHNDGEFEGLEYLFDQIPGLQCDFCYKQFNNKFILKTHITSKHIKLEAEDS